MKEIDLNSSLKFRKLGSIVDSTAKGMNNSNIWQFGRSN